MSYEPPMLAANDVKAIKKDKSRETVTFKCTALVLRQVNNKA